MKMVLVQFKVNFFHTFFTYCKYIFLCYSNFCYRFFGSNHNSDFLLNIFMKKVEDKMNKKTFRIENSDFVFHKRNTHLVIVVCVHWGLDDFFPKFQNFDFFLFILFVCSSVLLNTGFGFNAHSHWNSLSFIFSAKKLSMTVTLTLP